MLISLDRICPNACWHNVLRKTFQVLVSYLLVLHHSLTNQLYCLQNTVRSTLYLAVSVTSCNIFYLSSICYKQVMVHSCVIVDCFSYEPGFFSNIRILYPYNTLPLYPYRQYRRLWFHRCITAPIDMSHCVFSGKSILKEFFSYGYCLVRIICISFFAQDFNSDVVLIYSVKEFVQNHHLILYIYITNLV